MDYAFREQALIFKRTMQYAQDFIDVCHTLSEKHQLHQAFLSEGGRHADKFQTKKDCQFFLELYADDIQNAVKCSAKDFHQAHSCTEIVKTGISYKTDSVTLDVFCKVWTKIYWVLTNQQLVWYGLKKIYRLLVSSQPMPNAHAADGDVQALMKYIVKDSSKFLAMADRQAYKFSEVPYMTCHNTEGGATVVDPTQKVSSS
jgi:hypothetical protein